MNQQIGRYQVQGELGRGGFGRVYRAHDPTVGRPVAIKTLNSSGERDMLTRFRNEAAAAGKLHHHNIVTIYDFGEHDGAPFLVMELLDGEDIERIIANNRPLPLVKKLDVMTQAAAGLHHAHARGIVHRDVKPANIMLLANGSVKIMDFGIALLTEATGERITPQGSMIGTLPYMAPEQFFGSASSVMTDIFAFGVTFYKFLTGRHPFQAAELGSMMHNIANQQPAPLRTIDPGFPEALEQVIDKLLAKSPELRYQSLEDVQFDLEPIILDLRKENVGQLIAESRNLIAADKFDTAQALVRQVMEIDPANRTARELRETIQRQIKDRAIRPRIAALVNAGREHLVVRQFDAAIQSFEAALALEKSNAELNRLIEQARTASERAHHADRLLEEAQQALGREDLTSAHSYVKDALHSDPENARAEILLKDLRRRMELRRREQRLHEGRNHLKGLMLQHSFGQVIEAASRLLEEFPESAEVRRVLERARQERDAQARSEQLQNAVVDVRGLLGNRQFTEAVQRLAQLRSEHPEATELRDLASYAAGELRAQKEAEVVTQATAEARDRVLSGDFDGALQRLESALAGYPGLDALRDLVQSVASKKVEHQRQTALNETLRRCTALVEAERFPEAMERIDAFIRAHGDSALLAPARAAAAEGLDRQRQAVAARELIANAQTLLDGGKPGPATKLLEQRSIQFPGNPEVANLLGLARNILREHQRGEEISRIIAEAEGLARTKRFDQALKVIDQGHRGYASDARLVRCREAILASHSTHERDRARREAIERVRQLYAKGKPADALAAIKDASLNGFVDDEFVTLKHQIEAEITERRNAEELRPPDARNQIPPDATRLYPADARLQSLPGHAVTAAGSGRALQAALPGSAGPEAVTKKSLSPRIWLAGGIGGAALVAGTALFVRSPSARPVTTTPVEIHSEPPGASVRIEDHSCVTPNCNFALKSGRYRIEARLNGYQSIEQTVNVDLAKVPRVVDLTLRPLLPPPPPPGDNSASTGTLVVKTGVPDALVYVDGKAHSRTDRSGSLSLPLETKTHQVLVERSGFEKPAAQKVSISAGERQVLSFTLVPLVAKLELHGAPRGVEVRANGKLLGSTDGSASFLFPAVATGAQTLQITLGAANWSVQRRFESGQTIRVEWKDVVPVPPPQNEEALERQDWERVRNSTEAVQFRSYLGAHPSGLHAREAVSRIADLAWAALDRNNIEAVRRFAGENPESPHRAEAQKILDQYEAAQQRLAQERERQEKARQEPGKQEQARLEQARQEQLKQSQGNLDRDKLDQSRKQQVVDTLRQLDSALQRKRPAEVRALWPGASPAFIDSLRSSQVEMSLMTREEDIQLAQGADRAVAYCDLMTHIKAGGSTPRHQRVTVTLHNSGSNWTIEVLKIN